MNSINRSTFSGRKILIIHFRVGRTDGVSLEINCWKQILEKAGATVALGAGPVSSGADFIIKNLEQQLNPLVFNIYEEAFNHHRCFKNKAEFKKEIINQEKTLRAEFDNVIKKFKPDFLIVSNLFSLGEHLPAAGALTKTLDNWQIPTLAIHHDFYWENSCYHQSPSQFIRQYLKRYFPPKRSWLKHGCINSIAKKELWERKRIQSELLFDTLNFNQPVWKKDHYNQSLLQDCSLQPDDIIILQATRIIRRKNIELAMDFVKNLSLYDDRRFSKNKVVLVLAGYAEKRDLIYAKRLKKYAKRLGIKTLFIGQKIGGARLRQNNKKQYTLWDVYPFADLITYPSCYEGFGNQFLEACFAKKPVVIFEYPVFKADIKPKGFSYISLSDKVSYTSRGWAKIPQKKMEKATKEAVEILTSPKRYRKIVEKNFSLGKKHFSYQPTLEVLEKSFLSLFSNR